MSNKTDFRQEVDAKVARKLRARGHSGDSVWFGMDVMGLIGWSIVVPTLLGAALGLWVDKHYSSSHSWTLALLMAGLVIGCFNAWSWVARQDAAMRKEQEDTDG